MRIYPGKPYPLGATWDGAGVNFALFSENAAAVDLCLFNGPDQRHETRALLWNDALFGYAVGDGAMDLSKDERDSAEYMPKSVVIDAAFSWGDDQPLRTPFHKSIIYELHVKGFTRRHPDVPDKLRGTYAGLASPEVIEYLQSLGITAVELMPVHHFISDKHLEDRGLVNYWGYNTIGFFAPHGAYSHIGNHGQQVTEFKTMVKTFHNEGIEVILDVVYNHSAEGNQMGPTLCFRGIDNAACTANR